MRSTILVAALGLAACQDATCSGGNAGCNELANKPEWSLLEVYESRLSDAAHDQPLLRFENAHDTGLTVLAFPRRNSASGYVVLLENAKVAPKDKTMPAEDFVVSPAALATVIASPDLTPEAKAKIVAMSRQ